VTLNDLEWLVRVKYCLRAGLLASDSITFENNFVKTIEVYNPQRKYLAGTLVSGSIRFAQIFTPVLYRKEASKDSGVAR